MHPMPRPFRSLLLLLPAILLGCGSSSGEGTGDGTDSTAVGEAPSSLSLPVAGAEVRQGDLVLSVNTTGQIRSEASTTIKSETQGTVTEVLVAPGKAVTAGQALVSLDPNFLDIAVREAEAQLAKAQLLLLDNTVPDSIVTGKALTGTRLRNAEIRSGLDEAQVRLEKAKLERERAVITAPFSGVMDQIFVAVGERLSSGQDVARLVDLVNLRIEAAVLEHDLPFVTVGGVASVTTAAAPSQPVRGRVAAILPLVDSATRSGRALIRVRGNGTLRPGMYADIQLEANRLNDRILVPAGAVIERDGRPLVFVVKNGRAQWTYINPGRSNGIETEVRPDSSTGIIPVVPGDIVLIEGHLTLTHDAPVRVQVAEERRP